MSRRRADKLKRKKLDMIAANQVGDGIAFDCEDNALTVLWPGGKVEIARGPKLDVARELVALIAQRLPPQAAAAAYPRQRRAAADRAAQQRARAARATHGAAPIKLRILDPRIGPDFRCPQHATAGSAGMDLRACIDAPLTLAPGAPN